MGEGIESQFERQRARHGAMFGNACVIKVHVIVSKARRRHFLPRLEEPDSSREMVLDELLRFLVPRIHTLHQGLVAIQQSAGGDNALNAWAAVPGAAILQVLR